MDTLFIENKNVLLLGSFSFSSLCKYSGFLYICVKFNAVLNQMFINYAF